MKRTPGYRHRIWLTFALIAACAVHPASASSGNVPSFSRNEPSATVYVFNVSPSDKDIYQNTDQYTGFYGLRIKTRQSVLVGTVGEQHYLRLTVPLGAFLDADYHRGHDMPELSRKNPDREPLVVNTPFVSGQTYYAKLGTDVSGLLIGEFIHSFLPTRDPTIISFDLISETEGQALLKQLKPQELIKPPENASGESP